MTLSSLLHRLSFGANKERLKRRDTRVACSILGRLVLDRDIEIEGLVTEISERGVRFRGATTYIQNLNHEKIAVKIGDMSLAGLVRHTSSKGYGIQLNSPLPEDVRHALLAESEVEIAAPEAA